MYQLARLINSEQIFFPSKFLVDYRSYSLLYVKKWKGGSSHFIAHTHFVPGVQSHTSVGATVKRFYRCN